MPQANSVRQSPRPTLLCLEVHGRVLLQTWSAEAQPVEPLQHGDSPTLNSGQTHFKVEGGPKRSPGDGDEGPLLLTTSHDNAPIGDRLEVPSVDMRPITGRAVGVYGGKSSEQHQECLCKPRGSGISTPSPSWTGRAINLSPFYNQSRASDAAVSPSQQKPVQGQDGVKVAGLPLGVSPHKQGEKMTTTPSSPTRRQSLPEGPRHSKDLLYDDSPSGLTCTCPHGNSSTTNSVSGTKRRPQRDELLLPKLSLLRDSRGYIRNEDNDASSTASSSRYDNHRYRRSISLGQILQTSEESPYANDYSRPGGRTSYPGSTEPSPADEGGGAGRELSEFEKENLLFLKDLDNSYHRPLTQSLSNTSLGSTYSEDSLTGDSTPRGGSPYPGRREYPRTAYSPSKTSPSKIIRSISREEPEDDLSEGETSRDERRRKEVMGRKTSLPILTSRAGGSTSDSSAPSSLSSLQGAPAWWNSKPIRDPPPRKYSDNSISPSPSFIQAKMVFSHRSLSSPGENNSKIPTAASPVAGSRFLQDSPWRKSKNNANAMTPETIDAMQDIERKASLSPDNKSPSSVAPTTPISDDLTKPCPPEEKKQRNGLLLSSSPVVAANEGCTTSSSPSSSSSLLPAFATGAHNEESDLGQEVAENPLQAGATASESRKPSPMAFTIELGGGGGPGQSDAPKKLDITASISKWAPKHRRNLSLTKVEEHKVVENFFDENGNSRPKRRSTISRLDKVEERVGKPPVGRPRSGTIGATGLFQGRRAGGYHSEGYFSSDQDDEAPRRTADLKSPRSPRTPELRSPQIPQRIVRSTSQDSAKGASLKKQPGKPEGRTCCKSEKKPTVAEVTGRSKSEKGTKIASKMTPEARKQSTSVNSLSSCQTYDVKLALGSETGKEEKDDVSEAGTYTIEKDSSSPEVEQARNDIDRVFGVSGTESEADITPRGNLPPEEPWSTTPEADKFKSPNSLSRNSPNWIQQWAAQVAEHTKTPESSKTVLSSPRGSKPNLTSLSSSQESSESRPRRKLPTPPTHHLPYGMTSPRASDISDQESPTKGRARMEMKTGLRGSSFESHDSGGDSDLDTSTSYPINDDDDRLMKTFSSQQKTKLKLSGIDSTSRTPPVSASPRKTDPLGLDSRLKLGSHFKRERSIVSDSGLRRARLGCDESTPSKSSIPVEKKKLAQSPSVGNIPGSRKPLTSSKSHQSPRGDGQSQTSASKSGSNDFSRGDGGRFSLRLARSGSTNTVSKSPSHSSVRKELSNGLRRAAPRSNSTLSAKEVDFQNWKRRKNYDPMKAAAEGRKKIVEKKNEKNSQSSSHNSSTVRSPSPPGSLLRSASFHGTEGMGMSGRWPRKNNHLNTSEDDGPYSLEEEPQLVPHCSPLRRSPTSPHQLASPHITSPARQATIASVRARRSSYTHSDEGEGQGGSPSRKPSLDESGSEGKRSPLGSTRGAVSGRSKAKMEALDNLVISTIHSLSVKVRTTSETLLQKLKSQYDEEGDRAALLEEVLAHLSESDPSLSTSQSRSTSRELAGILRNLKKIEHALEVIDRVLVGVDDEDLDDDDLDETTAHEWGESDY